MRSPAKSRGSAMASTQGAYNFGGVWTTLRKTSANLSLFSGKFGVVESTRSSSDQTTLTLEEKPFGFETLARSNRICMVANRVNGAIDSISVKYGRQYVAPKTVPSLTSMRQKLPQLRKSGNYVSDSLVWVVQSFLKGGGSHTSLILCYDVATMEMIKGKQVITHTYYDPSSGKEIGKIKPQIIFREP